VPVLRFLADVAGAVFLCLTVPAPLVLGATALLGERPPAPTFVELGAAGIFTEFLASH